VSCPVLTVTNADFADCNGDYSVTEETVTWATDRPVYAHADKDRFIFWNAGGLGWSIGKREYLTSGSHWHRSSIVNSINRGYIMHYLRWAGQYRTMARGVGGRSDG